MGTRHVVHFGTGYSYSRLGLKIKKKILCWGGAHVEARGQLMEVGSLLPSCGVWTSNSGGQDCPQGLYLADPEYCPLFHLLK